MQHYASLQDITTHNAWLTIGAFDGVHIGHQHILKTLTAGASKVGTPAVVLTFYPHPAVVLRGPRDSFYLTTPEEKTAMLADAGIDIVITHPFNIEVASITALDFVTQLKERVGLAQLFVGTEFTLGHNRAGDLPTLKGYGETMGFEVHAIAPISNGGEVVSSSSIRQSLFEGNINKANKLLGKPFSLEGKVEPGEGRGRTIGIPTANLSIWNERAVPGSGVYVCRAEVNGQTWEAVTNIGLRPTFESQAVAPTVETHLLDFDENIYGKNVRLEFLTRLRAERKFAGVEQLVAQIRVDIGKAREFLAQQEAVL